MSFWSQGTEKTVTDVASPLVPCPRSMALFRHLGLTQRGWTGWWLVGGGEHPQVLAQIHSTDLAGSAATTLTQHFTRVAVCKGLPRATEAWPALSPRGPQ